MSEQRRAWRDVAALLGLSAAIRTVYWWAVPRMLDSADAVRYLETAHALADRDFRALDLKIPLLYPAFVAHAHMFFDNLETAGQAVSFLFSVLLVVPVYFLARELHGAVVGRVAGALVALWPWLIDYGNRVATEPLAVFLWITGALLLLRGMQANGSMRSVIGAAICFGGLHLARPEGTFILLGAAGMFAFLPRAEWSGARRKFGAYVAVAFIVIALQSWFVYRLSGVWTVNYRVGFIGEQPEGSTVLRDLGKTVVAMTADVPAVMLGPLLWAFFGVGLMTRTESGDRRWRVEGAVLYLVVLQWLVVIPVLSPAPRYLMSAFVALTPWVARGIDVSGRALAEATSRARVRRVPLAFVGAWMLLHLGAAVAAERWNASAQPWEYKVIGEQMRQLEPGVIVTRKPQVGFYADMPTVGVAANATLDEIIADAQSAGHRYLVVDERYTGELVPALRPLLDQTNAPEGLEFISELNYQGNRLVVYRFLPK